MTPHAADDTCRRHATVAPILLYRDIAAEHAHDIFIILILDY